MPKGADRERVKGFPQEAVKCFKKESSVVQWIKTRKES